MAKTAIHHRAKRNFVFIVPSVGVVPPNYLICSTILQPILSYSQIGFFQPPPTPIAAISRHCLLPPAPARIPPPVPCRIRPAAK